MRAALIRFDQRIRDTRTGSRCETTAKGNRVLILYCNLKTAMKLEAEEAVLDQFLS